MYYMHKVVNKVLNGFHLQTENGDYQDDEVFTNFFCDNNFTVYVYQNITL